jgi:hypothetical protein
VERSDLVWNNRRRRCEVLVIEDGETERVHAERRTTGANIVVFKALQTQEP